MLKEVPRDLQDKVMANALNKVAGQARTRMVRHITTEFDIRRSAVSAQVDLRRARAGKNLEVRIEAFGRRRKGRSMNVIRFLERSVTFAEAKRRRKGGTLRELRFKIKRAGGRRTIAGAFIGNKGRTVFRRRGNERFPIDPVMTIDVPQMFNTRRINTRVLAFIREQFPAMVERDIQDYLGRAVR